MQESTLETVLRCFFRLKISILLKKNCDLKNQVNKMRQTYSISYYCRNSKADKRGLAPIEISIIINGKRVFINLQRKEYPNIFKKSIESKRNNPIKEYLEEIRIKFNEIQLEMMRNGVPLTSENLKEYYRTGGIKAYTIEEAFKEYQELLYKRINVDLTYTAYKKYLDAFNCFFKYVDKKKELTTITPSVIEGFLVDCNTKYKQSTVYGIMTRIKTVIKYHKNNNRLSIYPFANIKYTKGYKDIEFLTEDEVNTIKNKEISIERLSKIRDLAVFQISSGMSYADTMNLRKEDIKFTEDGTCYIYKTRKKTSIYYTAVVMPDGLEILKKYDFQLPKVSNQKMNSYLKEIQTICGIEKNLHSHLFRKTYGTLLLNRGVRLETVSKCLGHSTTKLTETVYSKLLKETILEEVKAVI